MRLFLLIFLGTSLSLSSGYTQDFHKNIQFSLDTLADAGKANQKSLAKLWKTAAPYFNNTQEPPKGVFEGKLHVQTIPEQSKFTHELIIEATKLPKGYDKQGLDFGVAFLPTHVTLSLQKGDAKLFEKRQIRWENGYFVERFVMPDTADGNWSLEELTYQYDSEVTLKRWETLIQLAENYPSEESRAQSINTRLNSIDLENPEQLDTVMFSLANVRRDLEELDKYQAFTRLKTDPMKLYFLRERYQNTRQMVNEIGMDRYVIYYEQGQKALKDGRTNDALAAFDKATAYNPDFLPAYIEMAQVRYQEGDFDETIYLLDYLWHHPELDETLKRQTRALFYDIYYFFQQEARNATTQLKYAEGISYLEKAMDLCQRISAQVGCESEITSKIQRVRDSEFEYIVADARQAMYEDQFARALRLLQRAKAYQFKYADMVSRNKSYFDQTAQEMYELCLTRAGQTQT
ncbi:MAG: tetratricopeptide repeat protein, partial [Bacteroidota bacterium]